MATTWDPARKSSHVTLSAGNLLASPDTSGVVQTVLATANCSGKKYWEYGPMPQDTVTGVNPFENGISVTPANYNTYFDLLTGGTGVETNLAGASGGGGNTWALFEAGVAGPSGSITATSNSFVMLAYDAPNNKLYFGFDGTWLMGDPSAGTGGYTPAANTYSPAISLDSTITGSQVTGVTANFGATAFQFSIPTGYTGFDSSAAAPIEGWHQQGALLVPRQLSKAIGGSPT